jgi:predicted amidohydrolase
MVQQAASLDPAENRAAVTDLGAVLEPDTGLVVLPEAFMRDFGPPDSDLGPSAEPLDGPFVQCLRELAARRRTTVVAGMFEVSQDPARPFNTLVVVGPSGLVASYRKIHLYDSFGYRESDRLLPGPVQPVLVDVQGIRVGLMTCYDLRFPELARELVRLGAELLVVPSAWVAGPRKVEHWRTLVSARAIENTAYVAAVGQPGPRYTGYSLVVDPAGRETVAVGDGSEVLTATVSTEEVERARAENPSLSNRRF